LLQVKGGLCLAYAAGMPEVTIEMFQGRSLDQKRALVKDVTDAIVRNCDVPADAVTIIIHENARSDKAKGGILFSER
jgi:4-oxalocrotonate tautomerase